jgi:hypothetical protein
MRQLNIRRYDMVAVRKEDVAVEAALVAARIKTELQVVLGDRYNVTARSEKFGLNTSHIFVMVADVNPLYGITDNSPAHMKFMMHLTDGFGRAVDMSKVSFEQITAHYMQRRNNIKFRKVSSTKSIDDCATKLIEWFNKVKPQLDALLTEEIRSAI